MNTDRVLCVAYATDDHYAKQLGVSLDSLFRANAGFERIRAFVLDCGIGQENRARLARIAQQAGRQLDFVPMGDIRERLQVQPEAFGLPISAYARLLLASALPSDVERVLYLDCDTMVCDSLAELWAMDMAGDLIAGVEDTVDAFFREKVGLAAGVRYVNSGVLLMNLEAWRKEGLEAQFFDVIRRFGGHVPHHDQGTINGTCGARRRILPLRYNVMSNVYSFSADTVRRIYALDAYYGEAERAEALRRPAIVHFTAGLYGRPWEQDCTHPARAEYLALLFESPWGKEPLAPNSLKPAVRAFALFHRCAPRALFEAGYRLLARMQHAGK